MFKVIREAKNIVLSVSTETETVRYVLVINHPKWGEKVSKFDDRFTALDVFRLNVRAMAFGEAKDAGLDDHTADRVAMGQMSLAEALGDMDVTDESEYMEGYEDWLEMQGGEDDCTPSLEVIMAGGQAAWEYQNEKNAWLDSRF